MQGETTNDTFKNAIVKYPRFTSKWISDNISNFTKAARSFSISSLSQEFVMLAISIGFKTAYGVYPNIIQGLDMKPHYPELDNKNVLHLVQRLQQDYPPQLKHMSYLNIVAAIRFKTPSALASLKFAFFTEKDTSTNKGYKAAHYFADVENLHLWYYGHVDIVSQDQQTIDEFKKVHSYSFNHHSFPHIVHIFHQELFNKFNAAVSTQPWGGQYNKLASSSAKLPASSTSTPITTSFTAVKTHRNEISIQLAKLAKARKTSASSTPSSSSSSAP